MGSLSLREYCIVIAAAACGDRIEYLYYAVMGDQNSIRTQRGVPNIVLLQVAQTQNAAG